MLRAFVLLIAAAFVVGCTMPKTMIYSVSLPAERVPQKTDPRLSLALRVDSPRYLAQPYIASRTSPFELELSRYAKWDTPPRDFVSEALRNSLLSTGLFRDIRVTGVAPAEFHLLRVELRRFESFDEGPGLFGEVLLQAELSSPQGRELFRRTIAKKVKLDGAGFPNLAKGLSSALAEGIDELTLLVVETLREQ